MLQLWWLFSHWILNLLYDSDALMHGVNKRLGSQILTLGFFIIPIAFSIPFWRKLQHWRLLLLSHYKHHTNTVSTTTGSATLFPKPPLPPLRKAHHGILTGIYSSRLGCFILSNGLLGEREKWGMWRRAFPSSLPRLSPIVAFTAGWLVEIRSVCCHIMW